MDRMPNRGGGAMFAGQSMGANTGARLRQENTNSNSIDISNHSVTMVLMEPSDSVYIRGHNCKIEIGAGNTITHLIITGHNNKVYSKSGSNNTSSGTSNVGVVDTVEVMGHNNRVENIIANNINVRGHNNRLSYIACSSMYNVNDSGICNQF